MFRKEGQSSIVISLLALRLSHGSPLRGVVRGQIISLKNSVFVEAARSMGASTGAHHFQAFTAEYHRRHHCFHSLSLPSFIMNESFLSFLGIGVSAPLSSGDPL
jgi:oligopeptide transport system permease protein